MTDERRTPERKTGARTTVRRRKPAKRRRSPWPILILVIIVAVAAGWWYGQRGVDDSGEDFPEFTEGPAVEAPLAGDRAVVLVFPEWDASGFVTEERQITSRDRPGEDLHGLLTLLCEGPRISGAISALPEGTRALAAFVDPRDQSVVLDFSADIVTGHPGGSRAEIATLTSILRTVALNFPGTRRCIILVEGAQVETLAGHIDMIKPFDPRRWL